MRSPRTVLLVTAAVMAVSVVGLAWQESTVSGRRDATTISGQCPMSGGGAAGTCPYVQGKTKADTEAGKKSGRGETKGSGEASGVCPYSGKSGNTEKTGVRGANTAGVKQV